MAKPKSLVDLKKSGADENLGNFKSLAQKRGLEKKQKEGNRKRKRIGELNCNKVVKAYLETNDIKKTAEKVGLSVSQSTRYLQSEHADKLFKDIFKENGIDKQTIATIAFKEFLEYNREKVKKTDDKGRTVEEMRDGRLAFKSLEFIAKKLESDKSEVEITHNININDNTAALAIKQLINKVEDVETLKEIRALIDNKLANNAKIIDVN